MSTDTTRKCQRCGAEMFYDEILKRWRTVERISVDSDQCPDYDAGVMINDGHIVEEPSIDFWADAEIIHVYTCAQGIEDGVLVDVSDTAKEAGISIPVAMTREVFEDMVAWTEEDEKRKPGGTAQMESGRLWDVLWMLRIAAMRSAGKDRLTYQVLRVPREGRGLRPRLVSLVAVVGPGDTADPVMTIMQPGQD